MKVLVDIPEEEYERLQRDAGWTNLERYREVIKNGTPFPEGHGRLVDADRLVQIQNDRLQNGEIKIWELKLVTSALDEAETVIEADRGDTE